MTCKGTTKKAREKRKFVVIPYIHGLAHNLKAIAGRCDVYVLFSTPDKTVKVVQSRRSFCYRDASTCKTKHCDHFFTCAERVVYSLPLSCGKRYLGQTGWLREHAYNLSSVISGRLRIHCRDCRWAPEFQRCEVIKHHCDQPTREILEALEVARLGDACVNRPSIAASRKEIP